MTLFAFFKKLIALFNKISVLYKQLDIHFSFTTQTFSFIAYIPKFFVPAEGVPEFMYDDP